MCSYEMYLGNNRRCNQNDNRKYIYIDDRKYDHIDNRSCNQDYVKNIMCCDPYGYGDFSNQISPKTVQTRTIEKIVVKEVEKVVEWEDVKGEDVEASDSECSICLTNRPQCVSTRWYPACTPLFAFLVRML